MCWGVGRSGSPTPSEMTSTPSPRFSAMRRSSSANRYGGSVATRSAKPTSSAAWGGRGLAKQPLPQRLRGADVDVGVEDESGRPGQEDPVVGGPLHVELSARVDDRRSPRDEPRPARRDQRGAGPG